MIEFLEQRACSVKIKGRHTFKWGTCSYILQHRTTVARQRTSVGFKLTVRGDTAAGGLVAPLPCIAYFGKLAIIIIVLAVLCHSKPRPSPFVLVSQPSLTCN